MGSQPDRSLRSARLITGLVLMTVIAGLLVLPPLFPATLAFPYMAYYVTAAYALVAFLVTVIAPPLSANGYRVISLSTLALINFADMQANLAFAATQLRFEPFIAPKLTVFAVALGAPEPWLMGYAIAAICGLVPVATYYGLVPLADRLHFPFPEPWTTAVCAMVAAGVLFHRRRMEALERRLIHALAAQAAAERRAELLTAISDLANTPVQSIGIATDLLRDGNADVPALANRLESSLAKLRELSVLLARWKDGGAKTAAPLALDPREILSP